MAREREQHRWRWQYTLHDRFDELTLSGCRGSSRWSAAEGVLGIFERFDSRHDVNNRRQRGHHTQLAMPQPSGHSRSLEQGLSA